MYKKILAVFTVLLLSNNAIAQTDNKIDFRIEGDIGGQFNSNLAQINNFPGDFINSYSLTGTVRYLAPSQTQILVRMQSQFNNFLNLKDFNSVLLTGSVNLSQWLFNSLNIYTGVQPIQLISTVNNRRPFDMLYLGGLTYYYPINNELLFVGYQLDRINTEFTDFRATNHTFLLGLRHIFNNNFVGNLNARFRIRDLDNIEDENRYTGNANLQYYFNPWLTLQWFGEYTQVTSKAVDRNLGLFNTGVNIIAGYNNIFNF
jgi:hypothetical protein